MNWYIPLLLVIKQMNYLWLGIMDYMNFLLMASCLRYSKVISIFLCRSLMIELIGLRRLGGLGLGLCPGLMLLGLGLARWTGIGLLCRLTSCFFGCLFVCPRLLRMAMYFLIHESLLRLLLYTLKSTHLQVQHWIDKSIF